VRTIQLLRILPSRIACIQLHALDFKVFYHEPVFLAAGFRIIKFIRIFQNQIHLYLLGCTLTVGRIDWKSAWQAAWRGAVLTTLLLAPLHAANTPPSPGKPGVILVNPVGLPPNVFARVVTEGGNELEPGWVGDFSGGDNQLSDLGKWPSGLNLWLMGLSPFGGLQKPYWDNSSIDEEVRWGCDCYQKIVRDDGGGGDCVAILFSWEARDYYQANAPPPARCRQTGERVWQYMVSSKRPKGINDPVAVPPLGIAEGLHSTFSAFYEGSSQDLAHRVSAALPQHPDAARWHEVVRATAERYCETAGRNPWGLVATQFELRDTPATANGKPSSWVCRHILSNPKVIAAQKNTTWPSSAACLG
jgi:hypothetical protein